MMAQDPRGGHDLVGRLMTPGGIVHGRLRVAGGLITGIVPADADGAGESPGTVVLPPGSLAVPGFVDMHVHGGAGVTFGAAADPRSTAADVDVATGFHRRNGTTTMAASLVSAPIDELVRQVAALTPAVRTGTLAGVHVEGPFLADAWRGAHDPAHLVDPSPERVRRLLDAGADVLSCITIAPERTGALAAVREMVAAGVVVAIGHTAATYAQAQAAVDAGARHFTHLFNGMVPLHHRQGGPVLAAQTNADTVVELIADGVHLDDGVVRWQFEALGPRRIALVTDAMAAAGCSDGVYRLGGMDVVVQDARAHLADGSTLAGGTATMQDVVRRCVAAGVPLADVITASSATPASVLGLTDRGSLRVGLRADIAVLDAGHRVSAVMHAGTWC